MHKIVGDFNLNEVFRIAAGASGAVCLIAVYFLILTHLIWRSDFHQQKQYDDHYYS